MFDGFPEEHREFFTAVAEATTSETVSARAEQHERAIRTPLGELVEEPVERVRTEWRNLRPLVS